MFDVTTNSVSSCCSHAVVDANRGWVRHKLFPLGMAVYATPENMKTYTLVCIIYLHALLLAACLRIFSSR